MKRCYFDKYTDFACIADQCPATCCSGWLIEIDESSLDMYQNFPKEDADYIRERIDFEDASFKQQDNGDCAFLMSNGLCYIQKNHGEECLCTTCDMYPRHVEEFDGVREYSLSVSCPAVAESFLTDTDELKWTTTEDDVPEDSDYEDFDDEVYETLLRCRDTIFEILSDDEMKLTDKAEYIISYMRAVQCEIDEGNIEFACDTIPDECEGLYATCRMFSSVEEMFDVFFALEVLNEEFVESMRGALGELKSAGIVGVEELLEQSKEMPFVEDRDLSELLTRICKYYIFTYLCGSVYDEYYYAVTLEAVYNTFMTALLWKGKALALGRALTIKEASEILFRYSRELENSVENLISLEQMLNEK